MTLQRSDIYTNIPKTTFREKSRFVLFGNQKRKQKSVLRIQLDLHHEQLFFNALMLITCLLPSASMKSISRCRVLASARNPYSLAPSLLLTSRCTNGVKKGIRSSYSTRKQLWHCNKHSIAQFKSSFSFSKQYGNLYHKNTLPSK